MFQVKMTGIDKLKGNLEKLSSNAKKLGGTHKFSDILTDQFIRKNTRFFSLEDMFTQSGFKADSKEDLEAIPDTEWEQFIANNTKFTKWKDMLKSAVGEFATKKLTT